MPNLDYQALSTELAGSTYTGKTDSEVLALLADHFPGAWQELPNSEVYNYLQNHALALKLRGVTLAPAGSPVDTPIAQLGGANLRAVAFTALDLFKSQVSSVNPANPTTRGLIGAMQAAGVFSAQEVADFWQLFRVEITLADLQRARLYPKYLQVRQRIAVLEATALDLLNGFDVEID